MLIIAAPHIRNARRDHATLALVEMAPLESGPAARPIHPDWARRVRDHCVAAGVPFFFKQWGEWMPAPEEMNFAEAAAWVGERKFEHHSSGHTLVRVGKKIAGDRLDGVQWHQFPNFRH
jgi:protein gp37